MKKLVLAILLFSGCDNLKDEVNDNSDSNILQSDKLEKPKNIKDDSNLHPERNLKYWGNWKNIQTDEKLYITSKNQVLVTEIEDNLIQIGSDYYIRTGARNVKISGSVYDDGTGRTIKGFESIGNVDIILQNLLDRNIEANITSQDDGTFKLVPKETANFKSSFKSDKTVFYANGKIYLGEIIIKNIGYDVGRGTHFNLSLDNAKTFESQTVLGSIPVNGEKRIPISCSFNSQTENMRTYYLVVEILDALNRKWLDKIEIQVFKGNFQLQLKSENLIQGILQKPDGSNIRISTKDRNISLPLVLIVIVDNIPTTFAPFLYCILAKECVLLIEALLNLN